VSKGVHNIMFTVSPDTYSIMSYCPNTILSPLETFYTVLNTTQYSKQGDVAPMGCQEISSMIGSKVHLCETQSVQTPAVVDRF